MRARRPPPKWAAAVFWAFSVNAVGLPQRQGILNGELLGEQLPELGGLLLSLGLEGLHPPGQLLLAGQQAPLGILLAAQPLRCLSFQPGGYGKSAVRAGYRDALHRLLGIEGVVGRFLGDIDIVGVGLLESGGGDLHELGLGV